MNNFQKILAGPYTPSKETTLESLRTDSGFREILEWNRKKKEKRKI